MKKLVRLSWFLFTATIYYFIDFLLKSSGANNFLRLFLFFLYALFVYVIPCRSFMSATDERSLKKAPQFSRSESCFLMCKDLSCYLYNTSSAFLKESSLPVDATHLACAWCAFFSTLKDDINPTIFKFMDSCFRSTFSQHTIDSFSDYDPLILIRNDIFRSTPVNGDAHSDDYALSVLFGFYFHSGHDMPDDFEVPSSVAQSFLNRVHKLRIYYLEKFSCVV